MSSKTLNYAAGIIRRRRASIGSPWRTLNPGQQALLVLAYLDGTLIPVDRVAATSGTVGVLPVHHAADYVSYLCLRRMRISGSGSASITDRERARSNGADR